MKHKGLCVIYRLCGQNRRSVSVNNLHRIEAGFSGATENAGVENAREASMESQNLPNQRFSFTKLVVDHWK